MCGSSEFRIIQTTDFPSKERFLLCPGSVADRFHWVCLCKMRRKSRMKNTVNEESYTV
jgi:hypothetical protein